MTHTNSVEHSPSWEARNHLAKQQIFITMNIRTSRWFISTKQILPTPSNPATSRYIINIIPPLQLKVFHIFHLSHACHMLWPCDPAWMLTVPVTSDEEYILCMHEVKKEKVSLPMPWRQRGYQTNRSILNLDIRLRWVVNIMFQLIYAQERTPVPNE